MSGKKNGVHITEEALAFNDARIPTPRTGDQYVDVHLAFESWCERRGVRVMGLREQIHASASAGKAAKKNKGGRK